MAKAIGTLGTIPTLEIGGVTFTDLTNLKRLAIYVSGTNNSTFQVPAATSGYQVTVGMTLTIRAAKLYQNTTTQSQVKFAQSDNDVGINTTTALTNPVYFVNSSSAIFGSSTTAGTQVEMELFMPIAAQKYFTVDANNASGDAIVTAFGYEA